MAPSSSFQKRVQPRQDVSDDDQSDVLDGQSSHDDSEFESDLDTDQTPNSPQQHDDSESEHESTTSLNDISFGALAKAQESLQLNPRKRKIAHITSDSHPPDSAERFDTRERSKEARLEPPKRTSKHAPTTESARKPVTRRRNIFDPSPSLKFRDPRFDPTVMAANSHRDATQHADRNYSFLSDYQASEILDLKAQIKKAKDPKLVADLKRKVMSMEAKLKNVETRQKENEIRLKHKREQREALRSGQTSRPYYLKDSDIKKKIKEDTWNSMGKQARDKAEKRRQKREKGKDSKDMPRFRRTG
ncbi:hypothetical protein PV10_05630 [Exophiala mesophila]|uniref:rRNA biogenesis protein RRP36 n=1 Tax=Exophiala mesophila TaxID=212818 RepID=A0A0D1WPU3_EXOME|nr:uncharacterized protein PV10_05630 [Exophiala mesophila]KIV91045.1 hypothetical protein PV10_05630 [Exophiala mesophila]